jgi:glycosyltransferase involved in cell wall biosynthesis
MKVSVVIATYNRAYIFREALESALAQTYRDFEILIVDDGSTDNTRDMAVQCTTDRVRYIRHEHNRGCSAAYNTGIKAATGDVITLLDSDDRWKPENLEREVSFLLRHPEVDLVFTDVAIVDAEKPIPSLIDLMKAFPKLIHGKQQGDEYVLSSREMYICLLQELPVKPTAALARRELYARAGLFNEAWPSGTDWDLFLRFSRSACFGYIDAPLSIQTRTCDATHRKYLEQDKLFLLELFTKEKLRLKNDGEALRAANRGIREHCDNLAFHYLYSRKRLKSIATYLRGYKETHEFGMLWRAGAALMPLRVRDSLRAFVKKT